VDLKDKSLIKNEIYKIEGETAGKLLHLRTTPPDGRRIINVADIDYACDPLTPPPANV